MYYSENKRGHVVKTYLLLLFRPVYAKPRLLQVNVRQNLSATGRNFGFTCHNDWQLLYNFALYSMM